ncbi:hypothetical protein DYB37_012248, partial [Aphanomyces astaci]
GKVYAAEFMLDGSPEVLTGGADRSIRVWDVSNGRNLKTFSCRWDGTKLLTNSRDNSLQLVDTRMLDPTTHHTVLGQYKSPAYTCGFNWSKASITPDGQFIAAGSSSGSVLIWDAITTGVWRENKDTHTGAVVGCTWSPTGHMLASCDKNGCLVLWK